MTGSTSSWCGNCGRQLPAADRVCAGCGAPASPARMVAAQAAPPSGAWPVAPGPAAWGAAGPGWQQAPGAPWAPPRPVPARGPSRTWLYVTIPAALVALAAAVVGIVLIGHARNNDVAAQQGPGQVANADGGVLGGAQPGSGAGAGADTVTGALDGYASASAPATSGPSVDGAGNTTTYQAGHMLDGDPTTAWRMDGDGTGVVLTFVLDRPRTITSLGLINGYAKTDPVTGEDRYAQNRRILAVTWTVAGRTIEQDLSDGTAQLQAVSFPAVTASTIRLRIDAVTAPGIARYDHTVISDVLIAN